MKKVSAEWMDLEEMFNRMEDLIERARYLADEIEIGFFSKFDIESEESLLGIRVDFRRKAAFMRILTETLQSISNTMLPYSWLEAVTVSKTKEKEGATNAAQV